MKKMRYLLLALLLICLCAGCGNNQKEALQQGEEALSEGRLDDAKVCFQGALSTKGGQRYRRMSGAAYRYLGIIAYQEEDLEEAERYLVSATEYSDDKEVLADSYAYLGEVYERTGREEEAVQAWSQSLDKQKNDVLAMKRMFLQWKLGKMSDQEASDELAGRFTKGDTLAGLYLAQIYEKAGDTEQAVKLYDEIYEKEKDPQVLLMLAECLRKAGDAEGMMEALAEAESAVEGEDLMAVLRNEIAWYESERDYEKALEKAEKYLKIAGADEEMQKERTYLRTRLGLKEEETETQP